MKKMPENHLQPEIYVSETGKGFKRWLLVGLLFLVTFIFTFPFEKTLIGMTEKIIRSQRACPISYDKIELSYFFPGINFKNPVIAGACFQKPGSDLALDQLAITFAGPNFSPFGVRFKILATTDESHIEAYPAVGITGRVVRITDTKIGADILSTLTGMDLIAGELGIDGLVEIAENQISSAKLKIESQSLKTKQANIAGFLLPPMNLGSLVLLSEMDAGGKLFIEKLTLGAPNSTLAANFKGSMTLNRYNMLYSNADLTGEIRFSDEFFEAIPLVKLLLQGKEPTDGFYKLELKGPLGQTRPNFL